MACDPSVAETIETLTDRLQTSTHLADRRDAARAIRALSKEYRVEVCAQAMDAILQSINNDKEDLDMVNYCLDTLNYILTGSIADQSAANWPDCDNLDSRSKAHDPGREIAEIFLKRSENVVIILDFVIDNDVRTRWVAVKILCGLARQKLTMLQDAILSFPLGISRLVQLIGDELEHIRNDALILFVRLTQANQNIQNLVAFENCFDKLTYIIGAENYLDGTLPVIMDCLQILLNLIQYNESNQVLFREGSNIQKLLPFLNNIQTIQWSQDRTACLVLVLQVIDSMIVPTNSPVHVQACQSIMLRSGLLDRLCELLKADAMPIGVCYETMNTAADMIRGNLDSNAHIVMSSSAMIPIIILSKMKETRHCQDCERKIADLDDKVANAYDYMHTLHNYVSNLPNK